MHTSKKRLSPKDVEAEYGYPERTLETWRARGQGPAFLKIGSSVYYRRVDIEAWEASNRVVPQGSASIYAQNNNPSGPPTPAMN
jgi:hypothetical protein